MGFGESVVKNCEECRYPKYHQESPTLEQNENEMQAVQEEIMEKGLYEDLPERRWEAPPICLDRVLMKFDSIR